jgi:hypothetical protein
MKASLRALLSRDCVKTILSARFYLVILMMLVFGSSMAQLKTWDGSSSTDWHTAANWTPSGVPGAGNTVEIPDAVPGANDNPVVSANAQCLSLTVLGGSAPITLTINAGVMLTVSGATVINGGGGPNDHKIIDVGSGTFQSGSLSIAAVTGTNRTGRLSLAGGTVTVGGNISMNNTNAQIVFNGTGGTLNVTGDMSSNGTLTSGSGRVIYNGAGQNGGVYSYNNLTLRGSGTKTFATSPTVNATLSLETTAIVVVTTGTVAYGTGATLQYNKPASYIATDEEWVSPFLGTGGVVIAASSVTMNSSKVLGNGTDTPLAISAGATLNTSNFALTLQGDFTNAGTFTAGSSDISIAGTATQSIAPFTTTGTLSLTKTAGTATLQGNINAAALSINGAGGTLNLGTGRTHVITGNWTRIAGTLNGATSLLRIGGTAVGAGGTFSAGTGTVEWNAAGSQTIAGVDYYNLTLSGSGIKTLQVGSNGIGGNFVLSGSAQATAVVNMTIGGGVTLGTGTTFNAGAFTHNIAGNWTNNGAAFSDGGGTINLNGAAQAIGGSNTFNNLTLSGSNTKTFNAPTFITSTLTIGSGVVVNLRTFLTHTANTLLFGNAGQAAGTWGGTGSSAANINSTFFANAAGIITVAAKAPTTYYTHQGGDWNNPATWSTITYSNATNNGTFPAAGDVVNVGGGNYTVTVNVNSACASLNYLQNSTSDPIVAISPSIILDVSGEIDIPSGGTLFNGANNTLAVGSGTLNAGSINFSGGSSLGGAHIMTISTGTVMVTGDVTQGGLFPATITFSGAGLLRLGGAFPDYTTLTPNAGTVEYFGAVDQVMAHFLLTGSDYNNVILSGTGVKTVEGNLDINGSLTLSSGTTFTGGSFSHTLAGDWINNGATFDYPSSTIVLDGGLQTIGGTTATTFDNLTLAGTNSKSFVRSTTMEGILAINSGVTANLGIITTHVARALTLNGSGQVSGTWGGTSSGATNINTTFFVTATGRITITNRVYYSRATAGTKNWDASGTWSTVGYASAVNLGNFPVTGDIVNMGGADLTINVNIASAACGSINFEPDQDFTTILAISATNTLSVSGNIDIASAGNNDNNTLAVGNGTLNAGSIAFSATGPLVFGDHTFTINNGTAIISGDVFYSGIGLFTPATITFTGTGSLTLRGGLLLNDGNCNFSAGTGTVNYSSTTKVQSVADFVYYNLTLNNTFGLAGTAPQFSMEGDTEVLNALTMTSGRVNMNGSDFTLGASGTASTLTRTSSTTTNWMYNGTFERYWLNATAVTSNSGANYGLFPVGHSTASSYRPVEINSTANPNTGLVSVTHTDATTVTDLSPVYSDAGTNIIRKDNAQYVIASTVGAGTYNVNITRTDLYVTGALTDIRLAVSNGANTVTSFGTHLAATGSVSNPTARRTAVDDSNLAGDWRISTISLSTPLPIELNFFKAALVGDQVALDWETATEFNNALFTVEKTTDFETFYTVGNIDGKGESRTASKYSMIDLSPISGKSYYRLRQTDLDGKFSYSQPVMINYEGASVPTLSVYPNPTKGSFVNLVISGLRGVREIPVKIFNPQGQVVFETIMTTENDGTFQNELQIGDHLSKGIYIIKAGRTLSLTRKLAIE